MYKQFLTTSDNLSGIRTRQLILPVLTAASGRPSDASDSRTAAPPRSAGVPPSGEYPAPPGRHKHVDDSDRSRRDRDLILGLLIAAVLAAMVALAL